MHDILDIISITSALNNFAGVSIACVIMSLPAYLHLRYTMCGRMHFMSVFSAHLIISVSRCILYADKYNVDDDIIRN